MPDAPPNRPDHPEPPTHICHPEPPTHPCHPEPAAAGEGSPPGVAPARPRRKHTVSERALAARRANLQKARAAPKERIYRPTEKRQAASRANIQKAIAWRRSPEGNARARLNALKHGLFARQLEDSLRRLKESPAELQRHLRLFEQLLLPQDETEARLIRRLAEASWRRLRLFRAQARWETDRLHAALRLAPLTDRLTPEETERRAFALVELLSNWERFFREAGKLQSEIEGLLRRLLARRSGGGPVFRFLARRRERFLQEAKEMADDEFYERWVNLTPARAVQILRQVEERFRGNLASPP